MNSFSALAYFVCHYTHLDFPVVWTSTENSALSSPTSSPPPLSLCFSFSSCLFLHSSKKRGRKKKEKTKCGKREKARRVIRSDPAASRTEQKSTRSPSFRRLFPRAFLDARRRESAVLPRAPESLRKEVRRSAPRRRAKWPRTSRGASSPSRSEGESEREREREMVHIVTGSRRFPRNSTECGGPLISVGTASRFETRLDRSIRSFRASPRTFIFFVASFSFFSFPRCVVRWN